MCKKKQNINRKEYEKSKKDSIEQIEWFVNTSVDILGDIDVLVDGDRLVDVDVLVDGDGFVDVDAVVDRRRLIDADVFVDPRRLVNDARAAAVAA